MEKYHKINTIYKRDENKRIIMDDFSLPEFELLQKIQWRMDEKIIATYSNKEIL